MKNKNYRIATVIDIIMRSFKETDERLRGDKFRTKDFDVFFSGFISGYSLNKKSFKNRDSKEISEIINSLSMAKELGIIAIDKQEVSSIYVPAIKKRNEKK